MNVPPELRYHADHTWARREGDVVRVGLTDFAQAALGDVVFVGLPAPGAELEAATEIGEVESTKSVSDVYAPIAGTVVEVNAELAKAPEAVNADPYGKGWICVISPRDPADFEALLSPEEYRELTVT